MLINACRPNVIHVEQRILHQRHSAEAANLPTQVANLLGKGRCHTHPHTESTHTPYFLSIGPDGLTPMIQMYPILQETEKTKVHNRRKISKRKVNVYFPENPPCSKHKFSKTIENFEMAKVYTLVEKDTQKYKWL